MEFTSLIKDIDMVFILGESIGINRSISNSYSKKHKQAARISGTGYVLWTESLKTGHRLQKIKKVV